MLSQTDVSYECSCLQKKCGACALIVNGKPCLACAAFVKNLPVKKEIIIEPLKKFPLVRDLIVDRSVLYKNLKILDFWVNEDAFVAEKNLSESFSASKCLLCGLCLEVCPAWYFDSDFFSAAGFVPLMSIMESLSKEERLKLLRKYKSHGYSGCGKSLACQTICPAGIKTEKLILKLNKLMGVLK